MSDMLSIKERAKFEVIRKSGKVIWMFNSTVSCSQRSQRVRQPSAFHPAQSWKHANITQVQPELSGWLGCLKFPDTHTEADVVNQYTPLYGPIPCLLPSTVTDIADHVGVLPFHSGARVEGTIYSHNEAACCLYSARNREDLRWIILKLGGIYWLKDGVCVSQLCHNTDLCLFFLPCRGHWPLLIVSNAPACVLFLAYSWARSWLAPFTNGSGDKAGAYVGLACGRLFTLAGQSIQGYLSSIFYYY